MDGEVRIQTEDFSADVEIAKLCDDRRDTGGIVSFVGRARNVSKGEAIEWIDFEHYEGMAERELEKVREEALKRFEIGAALIVHRVGRILPGEQIVLVVAAARHRKAAFEACEFMIDALKRNVPIWKRERTGSGDVWVSQTP